MVDRGVVRHDQVRAERWLLHGIAKVAGSVDIAVGELDGTVVVGGPLAAGDLAVRGGLEARGTVRVDGRFRSDGSVEADASVHVREARLGGSFRAGAELAADTAIQVHGMLQAASVRCERFDLRGTATIPGDVVATSFDARLTGDSAFGPIQGHDVRLRGPASNVVRRVLGKDVCVTVERIEAETVFVEAARVGLVRAGEVVLGRDAHIVAVEGRVVRAHRSSRQGPESWSRPPTGLSR